MRNRLDSRIYPTKQVCEAANVPIPALGTWIKRGELAVASDDPNEIQTPGTGRTRYFTARRALHIALTGELWRAGLSVPVASRLALAFTDHNGADAVAGGLLTDKLPEQLRLPGEVFPGSNVRTVMRVFMHPEGPSVRIETDAQAFAAPFLDEHRPCRTVLFVDLSDLRARIMARLERPE
jgi:hypothetical protein